MAASERRIAEQIIGHGGKVSLQSENSSWTNVGALIDLPDSDFVVVGIAFDRVVRESELKVLTGLTQEITIWLPSTDITGECFNDFAKIPKLTFLNLEECRQLNPGNVAGLSQALQLKKMLCFGSNLGNELAEVVTEIPSLTSVEFGTQLTGKGLEALNGCEHLTEISLIGCDLVSDGDFQHLQQLPNLNQLSVEPCQLNDDTITLIASLASLKRLAVRDVSNSGVLDVAGLVAACRSLDDLDLSYSALTLDTCQPLQNLSSLKRLGVRGTGLTREEIVQLSLQLPHCQIYWDEGALSAGKALR